MGGIYREYVSYTLGTYEVCTYKLFGVRDFIMVFNATFNNISVISWQSILLVEETEVPGENHWTAASYITDKLDHIML